jgi:hypothetical protein
MSPEKWEPVFQDGHAQNQKIYTHPDFTPSGCALACHPGFLAAVAAWSGEYVCL